MTEADPNIDQPYKLSPLDPVPNGPDEILAQLLDQVRQIDPGTEQPRHNNTRAAIRAARALKAYAYASPVSPELSSNPSNRPDALDTIRDLLNDMHHLCDALDVDWGDAVRQYHYDDEVASEQ